MATLTLHVGRFYLNIAGVIVGIVTRFSDDKGYHFVDRRGHMYTEAGVHADEPHINLVREVPKLEIDNQTLLMRVEMALEDYTENNRPYLEMNTYCRNGRGDLVFICGEIGQSTLAYNAGFRFIDHLGRQYTARGFMSKWFPQMNLMSGPVNPVTQAEFDAIEAVFTKQADAVVRNRKIMRTLDPYFEGATYGLFFVSTVRIGNHLGRFAAERLLPLAA